MTARHGSTHRPWDLIPRSPQTGCGHWTTQGSDGRDVPSYSETLSVQHSCTWTMCYPCIAQQPSETPCHLSITRSFQLCVWQLVLPLCRHSSSAKGSDTRAPCRPRSTLISRSECRQRHGQPSKQLGICTSCDQAGMRATITTLRALSEQLELSSLVTPPGRLSEHHFVPF